MSNWDSSGTWRTWLRLAYDFVTVQVALRVVNSFGALLLVWTLTREEYAAYTILLTSLAVASTLSDLGLADTLSFFRRRAALKGRSWAAHYRAIVQLRRGTYCAAFALSSAYVAWVSALVPGPASRTLLGLLAVAVAGWFSLEAQLGAIALRLEQRLRPAYAVELSGELTKLAITVVLVWSGAATAVSATALLVVSSLVSRGLARRLVSAQFVATRPPGRRRLRLVMSQVIPAIPLVVHFALQSPLLTWLAARSGSPGAVADLGAISRLGAIFSTIGGFTASVLLPRLLVVTDQWLFLRRYLQWSSLLLLVGGSTVAAAWLFPRQVLWLLGAQYDGLQHELLLVAWSAVFSTWNVLAWGVNRARGWITHQWPALLLVIAGQVGFACWVDIRGTVAVLQFALLTSALGCLVQVTFNALGFARYTAGQ